MTHYEATSEVTEIVHNKMSSAVISYMTVLKSHFSSDEIIQLQKHNQFERNQRAHERRLKKIDILLAYDHICPNIINNYIENINRKLLEEIKKLSYRIKKLNAKAEKPKIINKPTKKLKKNIKQVNRSQYSNLQEIIRITAFSHLKKMEITNEFY